MAAEQITIIPFEDNHCVAVSAFLDRVAGESYYPPETLRSHLKYSHHKKLNASFLAIQNNEVIGARFSFIHPEWTSAFKNKISPELWKQGHHAYGYFKFLFLDPRIRGKGLGPKLSLASIKVMQEVKLLGVICHAWRESPNNSSIKYLEKMGFNPIKIHDNYWQNLDYFCEGCKQNTCTCSALEMSKEFYDN